MDVYIGHWTAYTSVSGADAFLHTFHTGLVRGYDEIALFQDDYQVMIWTDHIGMDAGDRSDPGLRGARSSISSKLLRCLKQAGKPLRPYAAVSMQLSWTGGSWGLSGCTITSPGNCCGHCYPRVKSTFTILTMCTARQRLCMVLICRKIALGCYLLNVLHLTETCRQIETLLDLYFAVLGTFTSASAVLDYLPTCCCHLEGLF